MEASEQQGTADRCKSGVLNRWLSYSQYEIIEIKMNFAQKPKNISIDFSMP
jgi:hypothetical protein